jgi:pimeloyl-ACP methyl ester carboxylesterase
MPVVIMAGTQDRIANHRRHSVWLHAKVAHSDLQLVQGVGHMIHYAVPEQIADAIEAMKDRAAGRVQFFLDSQQ